MTMGHCHNANAPGEEDRTVRRTVNSATVAADVSCGQGRLAESLGIDLETPQPLAQLPGADPVHDALEVDADRENAAPQAGVGQKSRRAYVADDVDVPLARQLGGHLQERGAGVGGGERGL